VTPFSSTLAWHELKSILGLTKYEILKTVLLTGASEGMGRSAAVQLSAKGANLILVARNVGRLEETLAEVKVMSWIWCLVNAR
jgi:NADP-dependent 3-hydroxy acid dehydrogenase YdfG